MEARLDQVRDEVFDNLIFQGDVIETRDEGEETAIVKITHKASGYDYLF